MWIGIYLCQVKFLASRSSLEHADVEDRDEKGSTFSP